MSRVTVSPNDLRRDLMAILTGVGMPEEDAVCVADSLLDAELGGVESHGLTRLSAYLDRVERGTILVNPDIKVTENGAVAHVDGGNGMGQVVMKSAVDTALDMAKKYGVGVVSVEHSNHFGTAAFYSRKLAENGCIGFVASLAGPTMAPFGGMDLLLGTNPFSIAFPAEKQIFCADMATSAVAKGKIRIYAKNGKEIPMGWALDAEGNDTTDPNAAIKGILLPMGGHKGYALAMAVDAICGLLSGASLSGESTSVVQTDKEANTGHFVAAIDIAHFLPTEDFTNRAQQWFDRFHESKTRPGFAQVMIPGEPETNARANNAESVSVLSETYDMVQKYLAKFGK